MTDKFQSILDKPASAIERPKPIPPGTYLTVVQGLPRYDKSSKKQTEFVEFTLALAAAMDDVDSEALEAAGGIVGKTLRATYYLTEDAAWRLKKFLTDLGFDTESDKFTLRQMIEESVNQQVYAKVKQRPSQDGKAIFAELADTAKVD